jgi:hypothetical protein
MRSPATALARTASDTLEAQARPAKHRRARERIMDMLQRREVLRLCAMGAVLFSTLLAWPAQARVKTKMLTSRQAVRKALGKHVAQQIPAAFDFKLHALVWLSQPKDKKPRLQIATIPAERPLRMSLHSGLRIEVKRQTKTLTFVLRRDMPCSGGMARPPKAMAQCRQATARSWAQAKKTLHLFATPRRRLRRVEIQHKRMPPRPSRPRPRR